MSLEQALIEINKERLPDYKMARPLLEAWIRSGKCPFGQYVRQEGKERGTYIIFPERLKVFLSGPLRYLLP